MPNPDLHHLPRLDRSRYQAFAAVHWTMPVLPRVPGWLDDRFHQQFRELQLHACARERLFCPAYCLMPDHLHFVWIGLSVQSNQRNAVKFFREHLNRMLAGENLSEPGSPANSRSQLPRKWKLQSQAHDHLLTEDEREHDAFAKVCFYVLANPVRAELAQREQDWPFSGAILPGYPTLHPFQEDYWQLFWRLYYQHRESTP